MLKVTMENVNSTQAQMANFSREKPQESNVNAKNKTVIELKKTVFDGLIHRLY